MAATMEAPAKTASGPKPPPQQRLVNALIYGLSGTGKTRLAMSALAVPGMCPILVFDVERGMIGIDETGDWDWLPINSIEDVHRGMQQYGNRYKTFVLDSATRLVRITNQGFASQRTGGRPNPDVQRGDYAQTLVLMTDLFDKLRRSDKHVIVTAGLKHIYDQTRGRGDTPVLLETIPEFEGKTVDRAQDSMDAIWCLQSVDNKRFLLTMQQGVYRAKSRRPFPQPHVNEKGTMADPTMAKIHKAFMESFK